MPDTSTDHAADARAALRQAAHHLTVLADPTAPPSPRLAATAATRAALALLSPEAAPGPPSDPGPEADRGEGTEAGVEAARQHLHTALHQAEQAPPPLPAPRAADDGHLPEWPWSPAARGAYGDTIPTLTGVIADGLYRLTAENARLAQAHRDGDVSFQVSTMSLEVRDDLLEAGATLDAIALSCPPGPYLPDPYHEGSQPPPRADELRADAGDLAEALVSHDRRHGTNRTPLPAPTPHRDASRDQARAYLRREWHAIRDR